MMTQEARTQLETLKANGLKSEKEYSNPVSSANTLALDGILYTFVTELSQSVLTLSLESKECFTLKPDFHDFLQSIFGQFLVELHRAYPHRGPCIQFIVAK